MTSRLFATIGSLIFLIVGAGPSVGQAQCTLPNQLVNGQTADASKVMDNFNTVAGCANAAVASSGAPVSGNLAVFSGPKSITSGDLSGDCSTSGTTTLTCNKASSAQFGVTKVDGHTIVSSGGVISATGGNAIEAARTLPKIAQFTWNNQGSAVATDGKASLILNPVNATSNVESLEQPAPDAPWDVYMRIEVPVFQASNNQAGFWLRNSSNGRMIFFGYYNSGTAWPAQLIAQRWTNNTTWSQTLSGFPASAAAWTPWLRVSNDGTTLTFYVSSDGYDWIPVPGGSEPLGTFLTALGGGLDMVGLGVWAQGQSIMLVQSFSFTAPN
ncbi:hypothetical protein [Burkholderia cenocepacia]|uniref:hypothetical protein n=1 Tax=Burkholderia cenocepacia TaxID=95486 RepID=UPI0012AED86F|nr:hypothetical protein [Burkholderia cenocepacia]